MKTTLTIADLYAHDDNKQKHADLSTFSHNSDWLSAIQKELGTDVVFALDQALMTQGTFLGRDKEYIVWVYGPESVTEKYNGIIRLGDLEDVPAHETIEYRGIKATSFNRTLLDSFDRENVLDMQGITEALSHYYETHGQSFDGLVIPPEYKERFEDLAKAAKEYYTY